MMWVNVIVCFVCLYAIMAISATLTTGLSNMLTMCQAAFYGIGAYVGIFLLNHLNVSFALTALIVMAAAGLSSLIISLSSFRLKGDAFILATLGFQMMVFTTIWNWDEVTGGPTGKSAKSSIKLFGNLQLGHYQHWILMLLVLIGVIVLFAYLKQSPYGRLLRATRVNNEFVEALGKNVKALKVQTFFISAAFSGLAGLLYASWMRYIDPSMMSLNVSILIITALFLGGKDHWAGALLGSFIVLVLPNFFSFLSMSLSQQSVHLVSVISNIGQALYGLTLIALMFLRPQGLIAEKERHGDCHIEEKCGEDQPIQTETEPPQQKQDTPIALDLLNISFGYDSGQKSVKLLDDVNLEVEKGKVTALIGGNGAGKTTLFNIISGFEKKFSGKVQLNGREITKHSSYRRALDGMSRMFQGVQLMPDLTLKEYLVMAAQDHCKGENPFQALFNRKYIKKWEEEKTQRAVRLLTMFFGERPDDLDKYISKLDEKTTALSYGEQRIMAFIALFMNNENNKDTILLLDEPTSGVNMVHTDTMGKILRHYVTQKNTTVFMVEHKMSFVQKVADNGVYLNSNTGRLSEIATPEELINNECVRKNYLGYGDIA